MLDLAALRHDDFLSRVGRRYSVVECDTPLVLRVDGVTQASLRPAPMGLRAPFSVLFVGPMQPWLGQGTFTLQDESESMALFLVPIGPVKDGMGYQAVFG